MNQKTISPAPHVLGNQERILRTVDDRWSIRYRRRTLAVAIIAAIGLLICLLTALFLGEFQVTPAALLDTLRGAAPDAQTEFFILGRRLPRALLAMTVGALLALAGAIFQGLTRNPLASPDVIGISSGASVGAVFVMLVLGGTVDQASFGAGVGALAMAGVIVLITARTGVRGVQLVLTGVALSAIAIAIVNYLLSQVFVASATTAQTWLFGSLQGRSWSDLIPAVIALALVTPLLAYKGRAARLISLGDGIAEGLGVRTATTRRVLLLTATLLVAVAVATSGPIAFVALVAPHIAQRLAGAPSFLVSALTGALLLTASDLTALYAFPSPIPVGAVTITLGGAFFLWLLWKEGRVQK